MGHGDGTRTSLAGVPSQKFVKESTDENAGPSTAQVAKSATCFAQDDNYIINIYR